MLAPIILFFFSSIAMGQETYEFTFKEEGIALMAKELGGPKSIVKVSGNIVAPYEEIYQILLEYKGHHKWVPRLMSSQFIHYEKDSKVEVETVFDAPWPIADRVFHLKANIIKQLNQIKILGSGFISPIGQDDEDVVTARVNRYELKLLKKGKYLTHVSLIFEIDSQGYVPFWVMNYIQRKWPVEFFRLLRLRVYYPHVFK